MQKKPPTQGIDSQLTPGCKEILLFLMLGSGGPWFAGNRFGKGVFGVNSVRLKFLLIHLVHQK
jgi:hypothetical protein